MPSKLHWWRARLPEHSHSDGKQICCGPPSVSWAVVSGGVVMSNVVGLFVSAVAVRFSNYALGSSFAAAGQLEVELAAIVTPTHEEPALRVTTLVFVT